MNDEAPGSAAAVTEPLPAQASVGSTDSAAQSPTGPGAGALVFRRLLLNTLATGVTSGRVPAAYRERYESLRAQLDEADPLADLPRALVHPDCAPVNAIASATGELVLVDWTAAGRGPRIAALGWLLWGAGSPAGGCDPARADAIAEGYGAHVRLEPEELARLRAAMRVRPLYFGCWYFHRAIVAGHAPSGPGLEWSSMSDEAQGDAIAARARERFETLGALAGQS